MESRLKVLGHPVHPMLVMFPVALLVTAVLFDLVDTVGGPDFLGEAAYWNITVGLVGGLLAAAAGAFDLLAIPTGTRAKRVGLLHAAANVAVILLFAAVWAVRLNAESRAAGGALIAIEVVAVAILGISAWLGGNWSTGSASASIATPAWTRPAHCDHPRPPSESERCDERAGRWVR
ncbi:DUF2231 domain-containing protein [Micromonospora vulcania]